MNRFVISLLVGMLIIYHTDIVSTPAALFLFIATLAVSCRVSAPIAAGLFFGALWAGYQIHLIGERALPSQMQGIDIELIGRVKGIPKLSSSKSLFYLDIERILNPEIPSVGSRTIRLSCYLCPLEIRAGERWQLTVRLKQTRGLLNPGGFDFEKWLISRGVDAVGYIRNPERGEKLESDAAISLNGLRQYLAEEIERRSLPVRSMAIIKALTLGDGSSVESTLWEWFRLTGTSHLLVISGLHITLVASTAWGIAGLFWRFVICPFGLQINRDRFCSLSAFCAAFCYAALAGFTVPTLRALIMLGVYIGFRLSRRHMRFTDPIMLALFSVLLIQPLSPLTVGFWLSFSAVGLIFYLLRDDKKQSLNPWRILGWHTAMTIGLLPLNALFFSYISPVAVAANFVAVPFVTVLVVPITLLATTILNFSPQLSEPLLQASSGLILLLLIYLEWLAGIENLQWWLPGLPWWAYLLAAVAVMVLFLPRGTGLNWLGLPLLAALLLARGHDYARGEFTLSVIDVGQGLSVLIETRDHSLLFDTGGQLSSVPVARSSVIPYLRHRGISTLDSLVISHPDGDHAAGLEDIKKAFKVDSVVTAERFRNEIGADSNCDQSLGWYWNDISFRFLNSSVHEYQTENDYSCVLLIESGRSAVLLTGDIEIRGEENLMDLDIPSLDLLLAPHHGSKTSSSRAFVEKLRPRHVVYSLGYRNRFGFPHESVQQRYKDVGSEIFRTDRDGLLRFHFGPYGMIGKPFSYRNAHPELWRSDFDLRLQ